MLMAERKIREAFFLTQYPDSWKWEEGVRIAKPYLKIASKTGTEEEKREICEYLSKAEWPKEKHMRIIALAMNLIQERHGEAETDNYEADTFDQGPQ